MALSALAGAFGVGIQSAKGTPVAAASCTLIPAASVNVQIDQAATAVPQEVGGSLWNQVSYKTGVSVVGDATFNVRAKTIGYLLKAFAGSASASSIGSGMYRHTFQESSSSPANLPWLTLIKDVAATWAERYKDCRVDTLRLDIPAGGIVTATFGFLGLSQDAATVGDLPSTQDTTPVFETTTGSFKIDQATTRKVNRLSVDFSNGLSRDERSIGSFFLDDTTVMRREGRITADVFVKDADWYKEVYYGGTSGTAWDPKIVSAELDVTIESGKDIISGQKAKLRLVIPKMDYLAYPVALAGGDLVRTTLSAQLIKSGSVPFYIELTNDTASY